MRRQLTGDAMKTLQLSLPKDEFDGLREAASRSGRSVDELVREAIRNVVLRPASAGPVALWDGEPKQISVEHDSVHDNRWNAFFENAPRATTAFMRKRAQPRAQKRRGI